MSIFSIGVSGLNTAQVALSATSNNISNVYTPGYNRELALLSENTPGDGVRVEDVQRQFNHFVADQLNSASGSLTALQTYDTQISQIDNLLADREAGLAPLMQDFFSSLQDLSGAPSDPAARQGVIGAADSLSAQFRSFDAYLQDLRHGINGQIGQEVSQINNTAEQIATLNREIALAEARTGEAPNSLLNQRDLMVADLSKRLEVDVHVQDGGTYNITFGNGLPLVAGTRGYSLEAMSSSADPSRTVVGFNDPAGNRVELDEDLIQSGVLGGLMRFRSETLDGVQNELGRLAVSLASGFNEQHRLGVDLDGNAGQDMFGVGSPRVIDHTANAGSPDIDIALDDPAGLTASDYDIRVTDAAAREFRVTRLDSGETSTAVLDAGNQLTLGGVVLTVNNPASLANGDSYRVEPVRGAARGMENLIQDTAAIAAGQGAGSGDNRNALALQDLQNSELVGGTATLNQAYASLVGEVGNKTNIAQVNLSAQEGLTEQLQAMQQSESGVNLDEEAANLVRYQQFYQANAKVIEIGTTVIDTLLGLR